MPHKYITLSSKKKFNGVAYIYFKRFMAKRLAEDEAKAMRGKDGGWYTRVTKHTEVNWDMNLKPHKDTFYVVWVRRRKG